MTTKVVVNLETGEAEVVPMTAQDIAERDAVAAGTVRPLPHSVGRAQAKIWLHRAGKLAAVQTYIDGANDAELSLWWDEATTFERQNPHILALAAGFDIDLDTAFTEAAAIV